LCSHFGQIWAKTYANCLHLGFRRWCSTSLPRFFVLKREFINFQILTTVATSPTHGLKLIYAGRVISGFGIGGISAVAPAFVSECSPKEVRGRITGIFQIMVATGVMLSYFVNRELLADERGYCSTHYFIVGVGLHVTGTKLWVIPFGVQLIPGGIMALGLLTASLPRFCW
jgi:MFS family permease